MRPVVLWIGILQVAITLVSLVRAKGLAILLSPAGFGVVSTIDQLMMTIVQLGGLGLPFAALKYMSLAHGDGPERFRAAVARFGRAAAGLALLATGLAFAVIRLRPAWLGADLAAYRPLLELAVLTIPGLMLTIVAVNVCAAGRRPVSAAALNFATTAALALAAILGVWAHGLTGLYVGTVSVGLAGIAITAFALSRGFGVRWWVRERTEGLRGGVLATSAGIYATMAVSAVSLFVVRYVVFARLGEAPAGLMQSAMSVALTVGAVLAPVSNLYLVPILNRNVPAGEKALTADMFAERIMLLLLAAALPISLMPHLVLQILYTRAFFLAADALLVFVAWQCVFQVVYVYQQLLIALDDMLSVSLLCLLGFGGAAALAVLLVPAIGLAGAPAALLIGMVVYGVAIALRLRLGHGVAVSPQVGLRGLWMLAVLASAGLIFRDAPELTLAGLGGRSVFALAAAGLTWALFLRGGPEMAAASAVFARFRRAGRAASDRPPGP